MPELPEVETTKNAIMPHVVGKIVYKIIIRQPKLRWPVPATLKKVLQNKKINAIERRAKYLILDTNAGNLVIHLGMSGKLRLGKKNDEILKHDHVDIIFKNGTVLHYNDPRRFGCIILVPHPYTEYKLFNKLGPEPLIKEFNMQYLFNITRNKNTYIKQFIMEQKFVVGVGNIYACEALFAAQINPLILAKNLTQTDCKLLVAAIKKILQQAIKAGGTTLKDFLSPDGSKGYFVQTLKVYGRAGEACDDCGSIIQSKVIAQRNSFFCEKCQIL